MLARNQGLAGAITVFALAMSPASAVTALANSAWAPKVAAVYKLRMAGIELATFNFGSSVTGDIYALSGHGKMTWGFGLFKYTGNFTGSGRISGNNVLPASYAYDWQVNSKKGSVRIGYAGGAARNVEITPPHQPGPDVVPLKPEHLKGVFDPLTSLTVLSRMADGDPCQRRIAVFEGKQRFDVIFSPLRQEKVTEPKPSGQPVTAHVCCVKYTPVAGHKMNRETQAAVRAEGIEVSFRPVPSAGLLVPYRIVLPTPLGNAILTAQTVEITAAGNQVIALTH